MQKIEKKIENNPEKTRKRKEERSKIFSFFPLFVLRGALKTYFSFFSSKNECKGSVKNEKKKRK